MVIFHGYVSLPEGRCQVWCHALWDSCLCCCTPLKKRRYLGIKPTLYVFFSNMFYVLSCFMWSILSYMWVIVGAYVGKLVNIYIYAPGPATPPSPPPPWDGSHILAPYEIFPLPPPVVWWGCGTVPLPPPHGLGPQVAAPIPFYLQAIGSISEVQLRIC